MLAQLAGAGRVEQMARVGRAHLEQHPHLELAKDLMGEVPVQVVHRVAPDDHVDAKQRAFAEDRIEVVGGAGLILAFRKAEVVFATA